MPADDYVPQADPPTGGNPILFRPGTYARHARAVDRVLGDNHAVYPRSGRGRTTKPAKGAWGFLASGASISACVWPSLGTGIVTLCSRSGNTLTADGEDVQVYNPGSSTITGPLMLELTWVDAWAVCVCSAQCTIHVYGCSGSDPLVGATVTITDSDGTTLDSGTTDASGDFVTTIACGSDRTVSIEATGYVTTDFTGQTLSSTTLNINMAGYLDLANYAMCCGNCPLPKAIHYTWSSHHVVTGDHSGSGTATYRPGNSDWPAVLGSLVCGGGSPVLSIGYDNIDGGTTSCFYAPISYTCDPLNVVFGMPPEDACPNFSASTGTTAFSMTMTA